MARIALEITIQSPIEVVFDLSRSVDFHQDSIPDSNEKAIAGKTSGLLELNDTVTWEAKHLGVKQQLTSKITKFDRSLYFKDEMVSGPFKWIDHDHRFEIIEPNKTLMIDVFDYDVPFGLIGKLVDLLFLKRYMEKLLTTRNLIIKECAENGKWKKYLEPNRYESIQC